VKRASNFEAVAEAIGVSVGKVRAYVERLRGRPEGPKPIQPVKHYATIKAEPIPPIERPPIKEAPPLEAAKCRELDALYDKWAAASPDERAAVVKEIYRPAHELGTAAGWLELHENDPDFPGDVAAAIVSKIPNFWGRNNAKFSTYAYSIAKRMATEWRRKRGRYTKGLDVYADYDAELEKHGVSDDWFSSDARLLKADLSKGLSREDGALLELMCEGRTPLEIAQVLDITQHAAESRIRRLRDRLAKKIKPG